MPADRGSYPTSRPEISLMLPWLKALETTDHAPNNSDLVERNILRIVGFVVRNDPDGGAGVPHHLQAFDLNSAEAVTDRIDAIRRRYRVPCVHNDPLARLNRRRHAIALGLQHE